MQRPRQLAHGRLNHGVQFQRLINRRRDLREHSQPIGSPPRLLKQASIFNGGGRRQQINRMQNIRLETIGLLVEGLTCEQAVMSGDGPTNVGHWPARVTALAVFHAAARLKVNVVPLPALLSTQMCCRWASIASLQKASPRPLPCSCCPPVTNFWNNWL